MKKTAIITGGSRGIGFAIARQLGEDGFNVVIIARSNKEDNADNFKQLENLGIDYLYIQLTFCSAEDRTRTSRDRIKWWNSCSCQQCGRCTPVFAEIYLR